MMAKARKVAGEATKKVAKKATPRPRKKKVAEPIPQPPLLVTAPPPLAPPTDEPVQPESEAKNGARVVSLQQAELPNQNRIALTEAVDMFACSMRSGHPLPLQWLVDSLTTGQVKRIEDYAP